MCAFQSLIKLGRQEQDGKHTAKNPCPGAPGDVGREGSAGKIAQPKSWMLFSPKHDRLIQVPTANVLLDSTKTDMDLPHTGL